MLSFDKTKSLSTQRSANLTQSLTTQPDKFWKDTQLHQRSHSMKINSSNLPLPSVKQSAGFSGTVTGDLKWIFLTKILSQLSLPTKVTAMHQSLLNWNSPVISPVWIPLLISPKRQEPRTHLHLLCSGLCLTGRRKKHGNLNEENATLKLPQMMLLKMWLSQLRYAFFMSMWVFWGQWSWQARSCVGTTRWQYLPLKYRPGFNQVRLSDFEPRVVGCDVVLLLGIMNHSFCIVWIDQVLWKAVGLRFLPNITWPSSLDIFGIPGSNASPTLWSPTKWRRDVGHCGHA